MMNCKPVATLAEPASKPSRADGALLNKNDTSWYRSMAEALQYLTLTRPNLAYAVQQVCLHMHALTETHRTMLK